MLEVTFVNGKSLTTAAAVTRRCFSKFSCYSDVFVLKAAGLKQHNMKLYVLLSVEQWMIFYDCTCDKRRRDAGGTLIQQAVDWTLKHLHLSYVEMFCCRALTLTLVQTGH